MNNMPSTMVSQAKKLCEQSEKLCEVLVEASAEDDRFLCYKESLVCPLVAESGKANRSKPYLSNKAFLVKYVNQNPHKGAYCMVP